MRLKADSWENRGTDEVPFGFVYFNDDTRVVFSEGDIRSTNWGGATKQHFALAYDLLSRHNVKGYLPKEESDG